MFPSISDYNQVISKKGTNAFNSLKGLSFIPKRTVPIKYYNHGSGSFAVVFKAVDEANQHFAIRCFLTANKETISRYKNIASYLSSINATWKVDISVIDKEIGVNENYYPVIKMDWIEGRLFNTFVGDILGDETKLTGLQKSIISLSRSLEKNKIGHGDIQPGNIIISKNANDKLSIKLIDYDGMYVPALDSKISVERGKSDFQHPKRIQQTFNEKIDRFSFWVIVSALEALKFDKTLWKEVPQGGYNTTDNLLFREHDFSDFNNSSLIKTLQSLHQPSLNFYIDKLRIFCNSEPNNIIAPVLYDGAVKIEIEPPLVSENTKIPNNYKMGSMILIRTSNAGATVFTASYTKIGVTPYSCDRSEAVGRTFVVKLGDEQTRIFIEPHDTIIDVEFNKSSTNTTVPIYQSSPSVATPTANGSNPVTASQNDHSGAIVVIVIIVALIAFVAFIVNQNSTSSSINTEVPTEANTTSSYQAPTIPNVADNYSSLSTNTSETLSTDTLGVNPTDTIGYSSNITSAETLDSKHNNLDDNNFTAQETIEYFFEKLKSNSCDEAWNVTLNETWELKGKDWFCSQDAFGGVIEIKMKDITRVAKTFNEEIFDVSYFSADPYSSNKCYKQLIKVYKKNFENQNTTRWMITKMTNLEPPQECTF